MLKKMLMAVAVLTLGGAASAATITWELDAPGLNLYDGSTTFQLVASDVVLSASQAVLAVDASYRGEGLVDGATAPASGSYSIISNEAMMAYSLDGTTVTVVGDTTSGTPGFDLDGNGKYLYLVVFNTVEDSNVAFAVGSAGLVKVEQDVGPGGAISLPTLTPEWIGGTYTDAMPEPTALALLALGIAGVALRRRVA